MKSIDILNATLTTPIENVMEGKDIAKLALEYLDFCQKLPRDKVAAHKAGLNKKPYCWTGEFKYWIWELLINQKVIRVFVSNKKGICLEVAQQDKYTSYEALNAFRAYSRMLLKGLNIKQGNMIDLKGCRFDSANILFELMSEFFGRQGKPQLKEMSRYISSEIKKAGPEANKDEIKKQVQLKLDEAIAIAAKQCAQSFSNFLDTALLASDFTVSKEFSSEIVNSTPIEKIIKEELLKTTHSMEHGLDDRQWEFVDKARKLLSYQYEVGVNAGRQEVFNLLKMKAKEVEDKAETEERKLLASINDRAKDILK